MTGKADKIMEEFFNKITKEEMINNLQKTVNFDLKSRVKDWSKEEVIESYKMGMGAGVIPFPDGVGQ